jgi:hypothetical protein
LKGKARRGRKRSCECSSRGRPGRWGGVWFPGWSGRVMRSPPPRGRLARRRSCARRARSRRSLTGLDREAVIAAVRAAAAEAVVHQMTALAGMRSLRSFDRVFAATNLLRTRGTDNLLAAAAEAGTRRAVVQSCTGWTNERSGGPVKTEDDPLDPRPVPSTAAHPACTTSWTTTRPRSRTGCPAWPRPRAPNRNGLVGCPGCRVRDQPD